jgi:hypothetical protein
MKTLHMEHLKGLLEPLLSDKRLASIAFSALLNSPSSENKALVESLITSDKDTDTPAFVLQGLLSSDDPESIRKLLTLIRDRKIPPDFRFHEFFDKLLSSDQLLPHHPEHQKPPDNSTTAAHTGAPQ